MNRKGIRRRVVLSALTLIGVHLSTTPLFAAKFVVMAVNSGGRITAPFITNPPVLTPGAKGFLIGLDTGQYSGSLPVAFQDLTFHGPGLVNLDGIDLSNGNLKYPPKIMFREETSLQGLDDGDLRRYLRDDTYFIQSTPTGQWGYDVGPGVDGGEAGGTYIRAIGVTSPKPGNQVIPVAYVVTTSDLAVSGFIGVAQDGFDVLGGPILHSDLGITARLDYETGTLLPSPPPTVPGTLLAVDKQGHIRNVDTKDGIFEYERPVHNSDLYSIAFSSTGELFGLTAPVNGDPSSLYRIDPESGARTLIGQAGMVLYGDIGFSPVTGDLYCLHAGRFFYQLDPSTGRETLVSQVDISGETFYAMAFDNTGTLYMLNPVMQRLSTVDPRTGTVLSTIPISGIGSSRNTVAGMAFDPVTNELFIATLGSQEASQTGLFSFDFSTGVATPFGRGIPSTSLAFVPFPVPEPSSVTMAASAIMCVALLRWRTRAR